MREIQTVLLPYEIIPVPACSVCGERLVAYLMQEVKTGTLHAVCVECSHERPGRALMARVAEFAISTRAIGVRQ